MDNAAGLDKRPGGAARLNNLRQYQFNIASPEFNSYSDPDLPETRTKLGMFTIA
jgi:hypothetical protein